MFLSQLEVLNVDGHEFRSAQATAEKRGQNCMIAQVSEFLAGVNGEQLLALVNSQPIPNSNAQALRSFHPSNASCKVGTEQSAIGSFVCKPANRCKSKIDR